MARNGQSLSDRVRAGFLLVTVLTAAGLSAPAGLIRTVAAQGQGSESEIVRQRAYDLAYNLDQDEAVSLLERYIAGHPNDGAAHRAVAAMYWMRILFLRGTLTVDDYLGRITGSQVKLKPPPPELTAKFRQHLDRAMRIAEERIARAPDDSAALYELGASVGLMAAYTASVEGRLLAGFQSARKAYQTHERVLELAPARKDAALTVGLYRYIVSTMSFPVRWMAYVVGFGGGKERGLQLIQEAAGFPGDARTEARFALVLLLNRERRFSEALRVIETLQKEYPRNRVLWLEAGATALRADRAAQAESALTAGLTQLAADKRQRMPGEEAMFHYKRGAARVALRRTDPALEDLRAALAGTTRDWVRGRTHLELAKLADLARDPVRARAEYEQAASLCARDNDSVCMDEANVRKARLPAR